jgi:ribosome-associated protein
LVPGSYCAGTWHVACARFLSITAARAALDDKRPPRILMSRTKATPSAGQAQRAAALCLDLKAQNVILLDLAKVSDATDYFVIASGTSDTHVRAVAEHVVEQMKKEGVRVHHVEGLQQGRWVLLDYIDFVVHVFHPTLREFYQLERLWSDADITEVDREGAGV